jgi:hypothetical protein
VADEKPGRVTWEIAPGKQKGVCRVKLVHDQLEQAPNTARDVFGDGRSLILSGLKTYLETGAPLTTN